MGQKLPRHIGLTKQHPNFATPTKKVLKNQKIDTTVWSDWAIEKVPRLITHKGFSQVVTYLFGVFILACCQNNIRMLPSPCPWTPPPPPGLLPYS